MLSSLGSCGPVEVSSADRRSVILLRAFSSSALSMVAILGGGKFIEVDRSYKLLPRSRGSWILELVEETSELRQPTAYTV